MSDISLKLTKGVLTGTILTNQDGNISIGNVTLDSNIGNFSASDVLPFNLTILPESLEIQVQAPEAGDDVQWLWTWVQSTLPYARASITNQFQTNVPLYFQGTYVLDNFAGYEEYGNMTQVHKGYFKWVEGAGLDNQISWANTYSQVTTSHPDINDGANTSVQRYSFQVPSSITVPTLTQPANIEYHVSFANTGAYTFGADMANGSMMSSVAEGENPTIGPLYRGSTYTFNLDSTLANHPFYLTTDSGQNFVANTYVGEYTSGVSGSRNNGSSGQETLTFTVPNDAPDTLYYQCGVHSSMHGTIRIKDLSVATNINGNYIVYFQHMHEGHVTPVELRPVPALVNQMCLVYDAGTGTFVPQDLATYVENTPSFKNKIREVAGTATLVAPDGVAVVPTVLVVEDSSYLPIVGNNDGDIAFDSYTNTVYVWKSNAWKNTKNSNLRYMTMAQTGNISAPFTGVARMYPPTNIHLSAVNASLGTPASNNFTFSLLKNGTSIGNYTINSNSYKMSSSSIDVNVSTTDYLTINVTGGSGASDLKVDFTYTLN